MKLITKLTMLCILISALEKLVTYVSMRVFPYCIGEHNLLALQVLNVLGLEFGSLLVFVVSVMGMLGIKKAADIYPKVEKAAAVALIILLIMHGYVLISNLYLFINILLVWSP